MSMRHVVIGFLGALIGVLVFVVPASGAPTARATAPQFVIYAGYADCPLVTNCYGSKITNPRFPSPWYGAKHLSFIGDPNVGNVKKDDDPDTSAIRIDNTGRSTLTISKVLVKGCNGGSLNLWGSSPFKYPYKLVPGRIDIFSSTNGDNFDGSEVCNPHPTVSITIDGVAAKYVDKVANGGNGAIVGGDFAGDSGDESTPWTKLEGGKVRIRVLPASLHVATVGKGYSANLAAQDTNGAPAFKVNPASLPPGLKLSTNGEDALLSGKPTKQGTFKFVLSVTDTSAHRDSGRRTYTLVVK
jgi:hypothetical protein